MVVATACESSARTTSHEGASTTSTVRASAPGDALAFREVLETFPYTSASCGGGRLVTPPAKQTTAGSVVLADSKKTLCYRLGPTLLTGRNVSTADAVFDDMTSSWVVNIHFGNDDFVQNVASVEVNKQIAIIVDGAVESAPGVNPGITGHDVQIYGAFDEAAARRIAAVIDPSSASRTPATPTTTISNIFDKRCSAFESRLGLGPMAFTSTSIVTADTARSALKRAHQAVPPSLANLDGSDKLALCDFAAIAPSGSVTPTTVCPNGDRVETGESPAAMYAVEATLTATKLPGERYLLPPGVTIPQTLDPCAGLSSR